MDAHIRDLSYTVGAAANRLVDDLFAQWESDPLPDHRIGVHRNHEKPWDLLTPAIARR